MRRAERVHPIITCPLPPLPFGWGDGEPPTPEDKPEETKSSPTFDPNVRIQGEVKYDQTIKKS